MNDKKEPTHGPGRPPLYVNKIDIMFRTETEIAERVQELYPHESLSRAIHLCLERVVNQTV